MQHSTDRILTTHAGSLARPADLLEMVRAKEAGQPYDHAALAARVRAAVAEVVGKQIDAGVDVVSDGEQGKPGFDTYVKYLRLSLFMIYCDSFHGRHSIP